jgi:hypothetical protein
MTLKRKLSLREKRRKGGLLHGMIHKEMLKEKHGESIRKGGR